MPSASSGFLDKVLGHIGRLDAKGLQTVVQRLARERSFLETLFNTIEDGILVVDENGRIIYFNQAVVRLFGPQAAIDEGQHISRILPELDWRKLPDMEEGGGRRVVRHEFEVEFPQQRFLRLYAAPLDEESGESSGVALILHDATEARERTFEAIESERIQVITVLAASVAHEVGNPLNALHLHLQLIERELRKLKGDYEDHVSEMTSQVKSEDLNEQQSRVKQWAASMDHRLGKLNEYLEVAKGEIGRLDYIVTQFLQSIRPTDPQMKRACLNDVAQETIDLLRSEIENRGQKLVVNLDSELPSSDFDPPQIQQVLVNLIKNAMQAMTKGGVLTVETGTEGDGVWISVMDTGPGIPQEKINRIFEPFFTTKEKGSGLGLMLVQRIIQEHCGRIELDSPKSGGTHFKVWLPRQMPQPRLLEAPQDDR